MAMEAIPDRLLEMIPVAHAMSWVFAGTVISELEMHTIRIAILGRIFCVRGTHLIQGVAELKQFGVIRRHQAPPQVELQGQN